LVTNSTLVESLYALPKFFTTFTPGVPKEPTSMASAWCPGICI
jgi:hypothetical protein